MRDSTSYLTSLKTNPFELVDFTTTSTSDLEIVIKRVRNANADDVILGYNFLLN